MDHGLREAFYNIRNQFDKQKVTAENVGLASCRKYFALLPELTGKVVLDAGIGTGWLTHALAGRNPAFVHAMDISTDRVAEVSEQFKALPVQSEFRAGSIEDLSHIAGAHVDFINCRDVIEHLPHPDDCLREFHRVLKPGGLLLIETVNDLFHSRLRIEHLFYEMLHFALTGKPLVCTGGPFLEDDSRQLEGVSTELLEQFKSEAISEHEQQWGPVEFAELIEAHGFRIMAFSGTPILSSTFFQQGASLPAVTQCYVNFVEGPGYEPFLEALRHDLFRAGRLSEPHLDYPVQYVLSDDVILLAEKV